MSHSLAQLLTLSIINFITVTVITLLFTIVISKVKAIVIDIIIIVIVRLHLNLSLTKIFHHCEIIVGETESNKEKFRVFVNRQGQSRVKSLSLALTIARKRKLHCCVHNECG